MHSDRVANKPENSLSALNEKVLVARTPALRQSRA
jgi:hypothetical protein